MGKPTDSTNYDVQVVWGVRVPMRDGVELSANLFLPKQCVELAPGTGWQVYQAVPAIIVRTPYGKSTNMHVEEGRYFARHGYAYVVVDVRGRGDSDGKFVPYRNEGRDGYDTVEWAAEQSWCTGAVGSLGGSYLGRIQWQTALEKPPHLKAMIPLVSPSDPFVEWPTGSPDLMHVCWEFLVSDKSLQNMDQVDWDTVYRHLPLVTMDEAAGRYMPSWKEACAHPYLDDWHQELSYQTRFNEIDVPALSISGWYDDEQIGTPLNYAGMTREAPSESTRKAQRLIMGPWPHGVNRSTKIGEVDFGPNALIDLRGRQRRFFDYWLKGEPNGIDEEPPVSIFVMGTNKWREEQEWPLARTLYTPWYLNSGGRANSSFGDGTLSMAVPGADAASDSYDYNPENPVPFITEPTSSQIGGPDDYSAIHRRDDVLVYSSDKLTEALEVTGPVKMKLWAKTSAPDTDFTAQLHDVWPNGFVQRLCDGMVRVRFRNGMDQPELLEPDTIVELEIDCWHTSHVFLPGHKLRVHVGSSAFPKYDRNLNTGESLTDSTSMEVAHQTVLHDRDHPSAIILPVIPSNALD